jgi:two-component system phosphate regulon sensor histidine kinase PhoR
MPNAAPPADRRLRIAMLAAAAGGVSALLVLAAHDVPLIWSALPAALVFAVAYFASGDLAWSAPPATVEGAAVVKQEVPATPALGRDAIDAFALPLIITKGPELVSAASAIATRNFPGLMDGRPVSLAIRDPDYLAALVETGRDRQPRSVTLSQSAPVTRAMRVHITHLPMVEPGVSGALSVFEDLTEQQATERMRMDFVANASHELRTPLASLLGFIETLQGPAREDARARERFLGIMREQAARMARLIDDLLSLSRAELKAHQQPTTVMDVRAVVREVLDSLTLSARERNVALRPQLPEAPVMIRGDRDDLIRIVENLTENAIRYGRDGGAVDISVTSGAEGDVSLSVRDYGPGIASVHIPRLTERFYRADVSHSRDLGGTGLGLAIVKHLVTRHRARLEIESKLGEGATFRVTFPGLQA